MGRITALAFARGEVMSLGAGATGGGADLHSLLAVANEQGKIRVWEIR